MAINTNATNTTTRDVLNTWETTDDTKPRAGWLSPGTRVEFIRTNGKMSLVKYLITEGKNAGKEVERWVQGQYIKLDPADIISKTPFVKSQSTPEELEVLNANIGKRMPGCNPDTYKARGLINQTTAAQCVSYAKGRVCEINGNKKIPFGVNYAKDALKTCDKNYWAVVADKNINSLYTGSIAVFTGGRLGHNVFIEGVERNTDGSVSFVYTSESNYNGDNKFDPTDGIIKKETPAQFMARNSKSYAGYCYIK